jgi:hypothetical protein
MKKSILLAIIAAAFCACSNKTAPPERSAGGRSGKAPPSVSSQKAEEFRAVERPSTYSD